MSLIPSYELVISINRISDINYSLNDINNSNKWYHFFELMISLIRFIDITNSYELVISINRISDIINSLSDNLITISNKWYHYFE